jgi:hypothetical protein
MIMLLVRVVRVCASQLSVVVSPVRSEVRSLLISPVVLPRPPPPPSPANGAVASGAAVDVSLPPPEKLKPGAWLPDDSTSACSQCDALFTLFVRRHHWCGGCHAHRLLLQCRQHRCWGMCSCSARPREVGACLPVYRDVTSPRCPSLRLPLPNSSLSHPHSSPSVA